MRQLICALSGLVVFVVTGLGIEQIMDGHPNLALISLAMAGMNFGSLLYTAKSGSES